LINPLGGHVGNLRAILDNLQNGTAILRFKMRRGAYSALFRSSGRLMFGTGARDLKHIARYFRWRDDNKYLVHKKVAVGGGEAVQKGWLGVKSEGGDNENAYVSFAIGDNKINKALFSILVSKCEWHTEPTVQTVKNAYDQHAFE
jgi:hypothetical protein